MKCLKCFYVTERMVGNNYIDSHICWLPYPKDNSDKSRAREKRIVEKIVNPLLEDVEQKDGDTKKK